jgi:hypothetical protein
MMSIYSPVPIIGNETGLVQNREEFLLSDDANPILENAYIFRERILRKKGCQLLGRLQRNLQAGIALSVLTNGTATYTVADILNDPNINLRATEPNAQIVPTSVDITVNGGGGIYLDTTGNGNLTSAEGSGKLNYATGNLTINFTVVPGAGNTVIVKFNYNPSLPVMGIRIRELKNSANDQTVFFDQKYAYIYDSVAQAFKEFIPGTTWNAGGQTITSTDFFWSTNYWISDVATFGGGTTVGSKLFWVTNDSGGEAGGGDPPRITDGTTWINFTAGTWSQIDATNTLYNWLAMLPFRGRMVVFNTFEGTTAGGAGGAQNFTNRIRWSTIGNPFIPFTAGPPAAGSWRDDIRGQGGFLDIPTSEDIVSVGFVRDNLVIYCERSTWQLRYTGRSIAPFQIEKVNSELGAEGPFSTVQFDTSLVGVGDKGIVQCDSYKSERMDIKIPDFVFQFNSLNNGVYRVHGIRDFPNRLAYWTVPLEANYDVRIGITNFIFPNTRLVYNYENDSWALFNDSLTTIGNYQAQSSRTWLNTKKPWIELDFPWRDQPQSYPLIVGGNQQGFIEKLNQSTINDVSLAITNIVGNVTTPTVITSPNHNLITTPFSSIPYVIQISGIPTGTAYADLNGGIFGIIVIDQNSFKLMKYNPVDQKFSSPQLNAVEGTYVGTGYIQVNENFFIRTKKFNFIDEGKSIQIGFVDVLLAATGNDNPGAISMLVYLDYDDVNASNILPQNQIDNGNEPVTQDEFFNSVIPTNPSALAVAQEGTKFWQRIFCATRANFLTLEFTFSNFQMSNTTQKLPVQIDACVVWLRQAGRMTQL